MHYGGLRYQKIKKFVAKKKFLIEDSCLLYFQNLELKLGTFGDIGVFSFYGNKNTATGVIR